MTNTPADDGTAGPRPLDEDMSTAAILDRTRRGIAEHAGRFAGGALILYAGANLPLPAAQDLATPSLSSMPFMGPQGGKDQPGSTIVETMERDLSALACRIFGAAWADARLPSCTIANLAVFKTFGRRDRVIVTPSAADGGHFSQSTGTPAIAGFDCASLPFDPLTQTVDTRKAVALIEELRPGIVMTGRSVIVAPDDLEPIFEAARQVGAVGIYDASHVAGLIAGGVFPDPLAAGADIVTMSTYKTLGGPSGAIVCGRDRSQGEQFSASLDAAFLANQDAARFPVLIGSLVPFLDGTDEPRRTVENAEALRRAFLDHGLRVLPIDQPARTHQVVLPIGNRDETRRMMAKLEGSAIIVGTCVVPGAPGTHGLRFGTQFVTRQGATTADMVAIGHMVSELVKGGSQVSIRDAAVALAASIAQGPTLTG